MNKILFLVFLILPELLLAQWTQANGMNVGRKDDIFFLNDSIGYAVGGSSGEIGKTIDGGNNWTTIYNSGTYLRSIEFIDEATGFCGSLDSMFLMTTDSGNTWTDIAPTISPIPHGICGIAIPSDSTIYACGIFSSPAFIIKSTDAGSTWTYSDMSMYASALVEMHFINEDTGFVAGKSNPQTDGGIILRTTDGGITWQTLFKTFNNLDYVWKIQSPDGKNYFGSVSSVPPTVNTTFIHSSDSGLSWTTGIVDSVWYDMQMIGFIDSLHGWAAGRDAFFETLDGGLTWQYDSLAIPGGRAFNRFVKMSDSTAFASAGRIYKYNSNGMLTGSIEPQTDEEIHFIKIIPNPTQQLKFQIEIGNRTQAEIQLVNMKGELVENFYDGKLKEGVHSFVSKNNYKAQIMFLVMRTNEGLYTEKVIFE